MNDYLTASLVVSPIDKWFVGPGARITRASLGVPDADADINAALAKARDALKRWDQTVQEVRPFSPSLPFAYPSVPLARPSPRMIRGIGPAGTRDALAPLPSRVSEQFFH